MKLLSTLVALSFALSPYAMAGVPNVKKPVAKPKINVEKIVERMGDEAFGTHSYDLKGTNLKEMITNFFQDRGEDEVIFDADTVEFADEVTSGTLSEEGVEELLAQAFGTTHHFESEDGTEAESEARAEEIHKFFSASVKDLKSAGVKFGYTPSNGYCGVSFDALVVFDVKAKKAYIVELAPGGGC